jgi:hypothetical protein
LQAYVISTFHIGVYAETISIIKDKIKLFSYKLYTVFMNYLRELMKISWKELMSLWDLQSSLTSAHASR